MPCASRAVPRRRARRRRPESAPNKYALVQICVFVCVLNGFLFVGVAAGNVNLFGWRTGAALPQLPANNDAMNDDDYHDEMKKLNKGNPNCFFGVRTVYDIKYNF